MSYNKMRSTATRKPISPAISAPLSWVTTAPSVDDVEVAVVGEVRVGVVMVVLEP